MAGYASRQATYSDGDTILATHSNSEFNQILAGFNASTGHKHDGTAGEGATVDIIVDNDSDTKVTVENAADEDIIRFFTGAGGQQLNIADGKIEPQVDNDIDLGSASKYFKNIYAKGTTTLAGTVLTGTLDMDGLKIILDADADTSITADTDDQIDFELLGADDFRMTPNTFTALSGSTISVPSGATLTIASGATATFAAGTTTLTSPTIATSPTAAGATWTDLGIVTTADINGGTIDASVIGGATPAAGTFTTLTATTLVAPYVKDYIAGLTLSNSGVDTVNDIVVAAGSCRDASDTVNMVLAASITKQLDATWAVGTNQGGLDTGAEANSTLYAIWLIKRSDTGVVDALFSASFTAPTMPTNYDYKRLIGAVYNNGSGNIVSFKQVGNYFRYVGSLITDVDDGTITSNTYETGTLSAPPWSLAQIYVDVNNDTETASGMKISVRYSGAADSLAGGLNNFARFEFIPVAVTVTGNNVGVVGEVLVNASRQCEYAATEAAGAATLRVITYGFKMLSIGSPQ